MNCKRFLSNMLFLQKKDKTRSNIHKITFQKNITVSDNYVIQKGKNQE